MKNTVYEDVESFLTVNARQFKTLSQKGANTRDILNLCSGKTDRGDNLIVLHGLWAHEKALNAGLSIHSFLICPSLTKWRKVSEISACFAALAEHSYVISERTFARITDYGDPDGILSLARLPMHKPEDLAPDDNSVVFVLDGLVKPGNVGVILRSCDGAGVDAVMTCHLRTRVTHPNTIKASMGAAFSVPIVPFENAGACKAWLQQNEYTIYIADPKVETRYYNLSYGGKIAVVMGNEHIGVSNVWYDGSASPFLIPMNGTCDSLNVSIAAAILAYEIQNKRSSNVP